MGIFTKDPATIARLIPRPRTPFVPAPPLDVVPGKVVELEASPGELGCESPAVAFGFSISEPHIITIPCGITLF
jgi:hypothetical protein